MCSAYLYPFRVNRLARARAKLPVPMILTRSPSAKLSLPLFVLRSLVPFCTDTEREAFIK